MFGRDNKCGGCNIKNDKLAFSSLANNRIVVQGYILSDDGLGGQTETWQDILTCWAMIKPVSGYEASKYNQLDSQVDTKIIIRYALPSDTKESAKYKALFDGREYQIKAVLNFDDSLKHEGKVYQMLVCKEGSVN